jgi:FkbM family methyltransferase
MSIAEYLNKPEYIFRPTQIYRRMRYSMRGSNVNFEKVILPWNVEIKVRPNESIGRSIVTMGVYDLSVTEALWRLIDPCETAIDVGANIGYMTSVMAKRVGTGGKIYSYEPHPEIYQELCENKRVWQEGCGWSQIESRCLALSDSSGFGLLNMPPAFTGNRGVASILDDTVSQNNDTSCNCPVALAKLDELVADSSPVDVMKIDVEGHELKVLQGGINVITRRVRDIVFEDHGGYPTEVTSLLESLGFTVFKLYKELRGPRLESPEETLRARTLSWEAPSYLATKDPLRAIKRLEKRGWQSFSGN